MKTLYALTHIKDGVRQLTRTNRSDSHFETEEKGKEYLKAFLLNNSEELLKQVFGPECIGTFEIRPVKCYNNGDAMEIYFDTEEYLRKLIGPQKYTVVYSICVNPSMTHKIYVPKYKHIETDNLKKVLSEDFDGNVYFVFEGHIQETKD